CAISYYGYFDVW
nr:immunoglobulin heavy chain junction region [Mus musculus]MBK4187034.1 immunoglobulin heavy chain junction region [Mus musculus]MBK4187035.1 immunoglobulin heavy chain junction region [Mus musculus]MBK4187036.1 immunoglobulin heavy chain junction region [Mus musculus]MBK4195125.1 immunoglobulin heavy chain junction region [Mus musculus]